jgi:regulator of protease activity HflC (stomatin/prohibitin superfamily)
MMEPGTVALIVAIAALGLAITFAFYLLHSTVNLVQQGSVGVVKRLGEFHGIHEPGLVIIAPFIDSIVFVDMREIPRPGDRQEVITKDNVVVAVNATIFTQVVDAKQALFSIANFDVAIDALARTALRSVIGTLSLDEALSERERINIDVQQQMEAVTDKWGIRINRIEIVEITPPPQILQALALQKQADQEKRAKDPPVRGPAAVRRQCRRRGPTGRDQGGRGTAPSRDPASRRRATSADPGSRGPSAGDRDRLWRDQDRVPGPDARRDPPAGHTREVRRQPEHEDRHPGRIVGAARRSPGDPVGPRASAGRGRVARSPSSLLRRGALPPGSASAAPASDAAR